MTWQEIVDEYLKNAPKDCTWVTVSDWVEENYSEEQIIHVLELLWLELRKDSESEESDEIRDVMDIFWRAGNVTNDKFYKYLQNREE